jgi:hypothetical protein
MQSLISFSHIHRVNCDRADITTFAIPLVLASILSLGHSSSFHSLCQVGFSLLLAEELDADLVSI